MTHKIGNPYSVDMTWLDVEGAPDDIIHWVDLQAYPNNVQPFGHWDGIGLTRDVWEDATTEDFDKMPEGWYEIIADIFAEHEVDKINFWTWSNDVHSDE